MYLVSYIFLLVAGGCGINADRDMVGSSSPRGTYVTTDSVDTHCGLRTPLVPKGIATMGARTEDAKLVAPGIATNGAFLLL